MQLTVVLVCLCLVIPAAVTDQRNYTAACYMDASTLRLFHHISSSICTHVIYSSAYISEDSSFSTVSQDADTGCASLKMLKERNPSLKILLGVEVKLSRLEVLTQNQASLDNFSNSTLKYLKEKNYDGLVLTLMDSSSSDDPPRTTETLTSLVKELKGLIKEDVDFGNKSVIVSVSLLKHTDQISNHSDEKTLSQYVDFISLLKTYFINEEPQIDSEIKRWQDKGVSLSKLVLAWPAFLRRSQRREHGRSPATVDSNPEKLNYQLYGPGLVAGKQVCQAIQSGQRDLKTLTKFESPQSFGEEVSWLLEKGLGGVGVVALDISHFLDSICPNRNVSEKAILESKVISASSHYFYPDGHGYSRHGHHHHHHHHHHHNSNVQPGQDGQSADSDTTGHHYGHRQHGHGRQGYRHHGHGHHGHGHHGHGHHGHGHHGHGHHGHVHRGRGHRVRGHHAPHGDHSH